jgi:hypothetical protein
VDQAMRQEVWAALAGIGIVLALSIALWHWLQTQFAPFLLGLVAGLLASFLWLIIQYELLRPTFRVTPAGDEPKPVENARWVHVEVVNVARGLLGGGGAPNCIGLVTLADGRSFSTKWADRPNPFQTHVVVSAGTLGAVQRPDILLVEQARQLTIPSRRGHGTLDIASKFDGDARCFIHSPENYFTPGFKPDEAALPPGDHPIEVRLKWDGGSAGPWRFVLRNGKSPQAVDIRVDSFKN